MSIVKFGSSYICVGGSGYTICDPPPAPPDPPTSNYFQFTNKGRSTATLTITSGGNGTVFVNEEFIDRFSANTPIEVEVPKGGIVKVTGLKSRGSSPQDITIYGNSGSEFSLNRFDESLTSIYCMFEGFTGLKEITSWDGAQNLTSMSCAFKANYDLVKIPNSWEGLGNVTDIAQVFYNTSITSIPNSWTGLGKITTASMAFSEDNFHSPLLSGGNTGFDVFSDLTNCSQMFLGQSNWNGNAKAMYDYLSTKSIAVTQYTNAFNNCTSSVGLSEIVVGWGGKKPHFELRNSNNYRITMRITSDYDWEYELDNRLIKKSSGTEYIDVNSNSNLKLYDVKSSYAYPIWNYSVSTNADKYKAIDILKFDTTVSSIWLAGSFNVISWSGAADYESLTIDTNSLPNSWYGLDNVESLTLDGTFTEVPSNWNGLNKINYLLLRSTNLTTINAPWSSLNTSSETFSFRFSDCPNLTYVSEDIDNIGSKLSNITWAFVDCFKLTNSFNLYNKLKDFSNITSHTETFSNCMSDPRFNEIPFSWGGPSSTRYIKINIEFDSDPGNNFYPSTFGGTNKGYWKKITNTEWELIKYFGAYGSEEIVLAAISNNTNIGYSIRSVDSGLTNIYIRLSWWDGINYFSNLNDIDQSVIDYMINKRLRVGNLQNNQKVTDLSRLISIYYVANSSCYNHFYNCRNVESGILDMYNYLSSLSGISSHSGCFRNCGSNTTTGAAELAQIPSDWK